jgi:hypothetical protein
MSNNSVEIGKAKPGWEKGPNVIHLDPRETNGGFGNVSREDREAAIQKRMKRNVPVPNAAPFGTDKPKKVKRKMMEPVNPIKKTKKVTVTTQKKPMRPLSSMADVAAKKLTDRTKAR